MQKKGNFRGFWGIIPLAFTALLAAAMAFFFVSCDDGSDDTGGNKLEIYSELQGTEWENTNGDTVVFDKNSVTITVSGGSPQNFVIKGINITDASAFKLVDLFFIDKQTPQNVISIKDGLITMVNFDIIAQPNRSNVWSKKGGGGNKLTYGRYAYVVENSTVKIIEYDFTDYDPFSSLTIPSTIDGKPVTVIGEAAFWKDVPLNTHAFTALTIPGSVISIENGAFDNVIIRDIIMQEGVVTINDFAFEDAMFNSIIIPQSVTFIGFGALGYNDWAGGDDVSSTITIGKNVTIYQGYSSHKQNSFYNYYNSKDKAAGVYSYNYSKDWSGPN